MYAHAHYIPLVATTWLRYEWAENELTLVSIGHLKMEFYFRRHAVYLNLFCMAGLLPHGTIRNAHWPSKRPCLLGRGLHTAESLGPWTSCPWTGTIPDTESCQLLTGSPSVERWLEHLVKITLLSMYCTELGSTICKDLGKSIGSDRLRVQGQLRKTDYSPNYLKVPRHIQRHRATEVC